MDSHVTAGINVDELFEAQRDRFDDYDAAAAVNAAQKLGWDSFQTPIAYPGASEDLP